ncbi:MAG: histidine phosphatase family protein [Alphaproteobacteria bacterium]|jgi:phosphohistidine phosphatase|nr:histidine phosphatase family protein [Alphaproteobacteria bacterium]
MIEPRLPRRLVLLRHAKSSWQSNAARDVDRPLAPRGEDAAPDIGRFLAERDLWPEWVLCSPAKRTRQTWKRLQPTVEIPPAVVYDPALYLASARTILARVKETPARITTVMVIGHNPGLQELAAELAQHADPAVGGAVAAKFPTAAVLALAFDTADWAEIEGAGGRLLAWRTPKGREPHEL